MRNMYALLQSPRDYGALKTEGSMVSTLRNWPRLQDLRATASGMSGLLLRIFSLASARTSLVSSDMQDGRSLRT